jgi:hypothetical protein
MQIPLLSGRKAKLEAQQANGKANGHANGKANGHANGANGHANGAANGKAVVKAVAKAPEAAPPEAPNPYVGWHCQEPAEAWAFMRDIAKCVPGGEDPLVATAQEREDPYRVMVFLSYTGLYVWEPRTDKSPRVSRYENEHFAALTANILVEKDGKALVLRCPGRKEENLTIGHLPEIDIHRIVDNLKLLRRNAVKAPDALPDGIAFDNVEPIEFYEAKVGANNRKMIAERGVADLTFQLWVITDGARGHFLLRSHRRLPNGQTVNNVSGDGAPFRTNAHTIIRTEAPGRVEIVPSSRSPPEALIELGLQDRGAHLDLASRYCVVKEITSLDRAVEVLRAAGLRKGKDGFQVIEGKEGKYLAIGTRTFAFTGDGRAIDVQAR